MTLSETEHKIKMVNLVNRYATPLAIILVALGLFLSQPTMPVRNIIVCLLLFSIVFNLVTVKIIKRGDGTGFIKLRMFINFAVNVALVYYLGGYWLPIWLLLALTPLATAIYDTRSKTLFVSIGISAILLIIQSTRRPNDLIDWGQQLAYASFIILVSLMINELSTLTKPTVTGDKPVSLNQNR